MTATPEAERSFFKWVICPYCEFKQLVVKGKWAKSYCHSCHQKAFINDNI